MKIDEKTFVSEQEILRLEITDDSLSAHLTIKATQKPINEDDIIQLLDEAGISSGFTKESEIERKFDQPFLIASGKPVVPANVEFELLYDAHQKEYFASCQLQDLQELDFVQADEPIAHFFITKEAEPGTDIFGNEILPEDNNILDKYIGENVYYDQDRSQIIAKESGYISLADKTQVNIVSSFELDKNLDINFDNFVMKGNLTVNGDIKDKIKINIVGNLIVNGDIDDAVIEVDGNMQVRGNIRNCHLGGISCTGNIDFVSAENAKIVCGKSVSFSENCHFCRIIANNEVNGAEENSILMGGIVQAGGNIEAAVIGSSTSTSTEVEITVSPYIKEKMMRLTKKLNKIKQNIDADDRVLAKLTEQLDDYEAKLEEDINHALFESDNETKHIVVFKKIFPGTYLRILRKSVNIAETMERVSFSISAGELINDFF